MTEFGAHMTCDELHEAWVRLDRRTLLAAIEEERAALAAARAEVEALKDKIHDQDTALDVARLVVEKAEAALAEARGLTAELVELRALEMNHDGACVRLKDEVERLKTQVMATASDVGVRDLEVSKLRGEVARLKEVLGETFVALVKAGPEIGDLATKGLPYAVERLTRERDEAQARFMSVQFWEDKIAAAREEAKGLRAALEEIARASQKQDADEAAARCGRLARDALAVKETK